MSFRDTGGRDNGDHRPAFFPAGSVDVRIPCPTRIEGVYVQAGASAATTVEILVNGADVAYQNPSKATSIPQATGQLFKVNSPLLNVGDRLQVTCSNSTATVSIDFFRA